jgi:hypothetical protein
MFPNEKPDLPFFDELLNDYAHEISRQDAYLKRGGKLSAPQIIKYDNRIAMMTERLVVIFEAVKEDSEALQDYLHAVEDAYRDGKLPAQVYTRFTDRIHGRNQEPSYSSERERDRNRVIGGGVRPPNLGDVTGDQLLQMYNENRISTEVLFQQLRSRQRSGRRLPHLEQELWNRYKSWLSEKRRSSSR